MASVKKGMYLRGFYYAWSLILDPKPYIESLHKALKEPFEEAFG